MGGYVLAHRRVDAHRHGYNHLSAATMRMTRTMMLEVLRQDYIRTAWSKGLLERSVILRHAVKNALIPVVSLVALRGRSAARAGGRCCTTCCPTSRRC